MMEILAGSGPSFYASQRQTPHYNLEAIYIAAPTVVSLSFQSPYY